MREFLVSLVQRGAGLRESVSPVPLLQRPAVQADRTGGESVAVDGLPADDRALPSDRRRAPEPAVSGRAGFLDSSPVPASATGWEGPVPAGPPASLSHTGGHRMPQPPPQTDAVEPAPFTGRPHVAIEAVATVPSLPSPDEPSVPRPVERPSSPESLLPEVTAIRSPSRAHDPLMARVEPIHSVGDRKAAAVISSPSATLREELADRIVPPAADSGGRLPATTRDAGLSPDPSLESPRQEVQVRIGRVEVLMQPSLEKPAPSPPSQPTGFSDWTLARHHLDRIWY